MKKQITALVAAALAVATIVPGIASAAGPGATVTVPGTAAHADNPFAVNNTPSVGSGISFNGVTSIVIRADGAEVPFDTYQNYANGGAFVAEFVDAGGAPIVLPSGYAADRVCDTQPAYPCTMFWPVGHTGPSGPNSSGTPGAHTSASLPVPAGAVDVKYAALDSDYGDNSGAYTVTTTGTLAPRTLLEQLLARVRGIGPGNSLSAKVQAALAAHERGDNPAACGVLRALDNEVAAQSGKKLAADEAAEIRAAGAEIRGRLSC